MSALTSSSIRVEQDDDEDFLPPGFLPPASIGGGSEQYAFLDTLEADLQAEVDEGRFFLKQSLPKSASSDDLVSSSSVLRSVLRDKVVPKNRNTMNGGHSIRNKNEEELKRLKKEKEMLEKELQKREMELSLEKHDNNTLITSLRRDNEILSSRLEQEQSKSAETIRALESDLKVARSTRDETVTELSNRIKDLEANQEELLTIAEQQKRTNDEKFKELHIELEASHGKDLTTLLDEMEILRSDKTRADEEVQKYKNLLEDKRSSLGATIRSLQRRMGAYESERDELKMLYADEKTKFKEVYRELIDCKSNQELLTEENESYERQTALLSTEIGQLETSLTEKEQEINKLKAEITSENNKTAIESNIDREIQDSLKAEMEFLHETLDHEIQANCATVREMQAKIDIVTKALEQERSNAQEVRKVLEDEQFYTAELEEKIADLEHDANFLHGALEDNSTLKERLAEARCCHESLSAEFASAKRDFEEAKQSLQDSLDHEIHVNSATVGEMQAKIDAASKALEQERSNAVAAQNALEEEQFYTAELEEKIAELEDGSNFLHGALEDNSTLKEQLAEALSRHEALSTEFASAKGDIGEAKQRLQAVLDHEIKVNCSKVGEMQAKIDSAVKAFEQEQSNVVTLRQALEEEQFYTAELEEKIAELEDHTNYGTLEDSSTLKEQLAEALSRYEAVSKDLASAERGFGEVKQREVALNNTVKQLKAKLATADMLFQRCRDQDSKVAREAMDHVNAMIKQRLDGQSEIIKSHQARQESLDAEVLALKSEIQETRQDLCHALAMKEETEEAFEAAMNDATKLVQNLQAKHEESLVKYREQYDLMEEDLLEALEREDDLKESHKDTLVAEQRKLADKSAGLEASLNEVTKLRTELIDLKDRISDTPYSLFDLIDVFRRCQNYFKDQTKIEKSSGQIQADFSPVVEPKPSIESVPDCYSTSSEIEVYASSLASRQNSHSTHNERFQSMDLSIAENPILEDSSLVVATPSATQSGSQMEITSKQQDFFAGQDTLLKPNLQTAFKVLRNVSQITDDTESHVASLPAMKDNVAEKKGDSQKPNVADSVAKSIPRVNTKVSRLPLRPPEQQSRLKKSDRRSIAAPSRDVNSQDSSSIRKRQSLSGISVTSKKDFSTLDAKKRTSISGIPVTSLKKPQSKQRSRLTTFGNRKMSLHAPGQISKTRTSKQSNISTPQKEDLSRKLDHLSTLSAAKLHSSVSKTPSSAMVGFGSHRGKSSMKHIQRPSRVGSLRQASCIAEATPLKVRGQVLELLSPESPLITPAKKRRTASHREAIQLQTAWRRYHLMMQFKKKRCAVQKLQASFRAHYAKTEYVSKLAACVRLQAVARGVKARLETRRVLALVQKALMLQRFVRMFKAKSKFNRLVDATVTLQRSYRLICHERKSNQNALTIQAFWRAHFVERRYEAQQRSAVLLQALFRKVRAKTFFFTIRIAIVTIQASWRRSIRAKIYVRRCWAASILIQSSVRRYLTQNEYRVHKIQKLQALKVTLIQACWRKTFYQTLFLAQQEEKRRSMTQLKSLITIQSWIRLHRTRTIYVTAQKKALLLQNAYRRHQARKRAIIFVQRWKAATLIQAIYCRSHAKMRREVACCLIQGLCRGIFVRNLIKKQHASMVSIQSMVRMKKVLQHMSKLRGACITIQRALRKHLEMMIRSRYATKLQSFWRGWFARTSFENLHDACLVLQSRARGVAARRNHSVIHNAVVCVEKWWVALLHGRKERAAAIRIQSAMRMKFGRDHARIKIRAILTLQSAMRIYAKIKQIEKYLTMIQTIQSARQLSATEIQACFRKHHQRVLFRESRVGCVRIQACWRRHRNERSFFCLRAKAMSIQRFVRKSLSRRHQAQDYAASLIQSMIRMGQHRESYIELFAATLSIQCFTRMIQARGSYLRRKSITIIQSAVRGYLKKSKYRRIKVAVTTVQSLARRKISQTRHLQMRHGVICLQSFVRMKRQMTSYHQFRKEHGRCKQKPSRKGLSLRNANSSDGDGNVQTRRSKRLRTEITSENANKENSSSAKMDSIKADRAKLKNLVSTDSSDEDSDNNLRRSEIMKLKVTELRRKLQQLGVESKEYNKLRKADLVEMVLKRTSTVN